MKAKTCMPSSWERDDQLCANWVLNKDLPLSG